MNSRRSGARWFALAAVGLLCVVLVGGPLEDAAAQPKPEGEMRWALYVTLSPMWFDPGEIGGLTPFWVLYAIHDALVKPMLGNLMTPLGPYKFVSHAPGIELVMEAFESYWRKTPSVKRLVFKSVPDAITRAAMLKRGEVDVAYLLDVPQAQEVKRDPTLKLACTSSPPISRWARRS
jgi:ABC-type transport system substrate-binding protein